MWRLNSNPRNYSLAEVNACINDEPIMFDSFHTQYEWEMIASIQLRQRKQLWRKNKKIITECQ